MFLSLWLCENLFSDLAKGPVKNKLSVYQKIIAFFFFFKYSHWSVESNIIYSLSFTQNELYLSVSKKTNWALALLSLG